MLNISKLQHSWNNKSFQWQVIQSAFIKIKISKPGENLITIAVISNSKLETYFQKVKHRGSILADSSIVILPVESRTVTAQKGIYMMISSLWPDRIAMKKKKTFQTYQNQKAMFRS